MRDELVGRVEQLSKKKKTLLILLFVEKISIAQAAELLGLSTAKADELLRSAMASLLYGIKDVSRGKKGISKRGAY